MICPNVRLGQKYSRKIYNVESWCAATVQCFRFNGLRQFLWLSPVSMPTAFLWLAPFKDSKIQGFNNLKI